MGWGTDMTKLIFAFRNFLNTPKKSSEDFSMKEAYTYTCDCSIEGQMPIYILYVKTFSTVKYGRLILWRLTTYIHVVPRS